MSKKKTNLEFINDAIKIHGNIYDYSDTNYISNNIKIIIKCKIHGYFEQTPNSHLSGHGCASCKGVNKSDKNDFVEKSRKIHGQKYLYDNVNYINNKNNVIITCQLHGNFEQLPQNHLKGFGCSKCSGLVKSDNNRFICKSIEIHGNIYDYSDVEYINSKIKVKIKCKKHGVFLQRPQDHLKKRGCPKCRKSRGELQIEMLLKENNLKYKTQYSFPDLKNKSTLYFDFGVIDDYNNLLYLIEYNGEQHYKYRKQFSMSRKDFLEGLERDKLKIEYCLKNNIKLNIIRYDEDINEKMKTIL